jgi:methionyl-tRNA formyltransferase
MNIVWLSSNKFGYSLLREAIKIHPISQVIILKDKSKTKMYDGIKKELWYELNIPITEIENINEEIDLLESLKPNIIIVAGWRQVIKEELLNRYTFIGFHPTLLPYGRGPAPIINSILEGLTGSGVTMYYLDKQMDSGDIIGQEKFKVDNCDTSGCVYESVINAGKILINKYLTKLIDKTAPRIKQDDSVSYIFKKPISNEIYLDDDIETMYRKIKAFNKPYNGAYICKDNKKLKIWEAEVID